MSLISSVFALIFILSVFSLEEIAYVNCELLVARPYINEPYAYQQPPAPSKKFYGLFQHRRPIPTASKPVIVILNLMVQSENKTIVEPSSSSQFQKSESVTVSTVNPEIPQTTQEIHQFILPPENPSERDRDPTYDQSHEVEHADQAEANTQTLQNQQVYRKRQELDYSHSNYVPNSDRHRPLIEESILVHTSSYMDEDSRKPRPSNTEIEHSQTWSTWSPKSDEIRNTRNQIDVDSETLHYKHKHSSGTGTGAFHHHENQNSINYPPKSVIVDDYVVNNPIRESKNPNPVKIHRHPGMIPSLIQVPFKLSSIAGHPSTRTRPRHSRKRKLPFVRSGKN